MKKQIFKLTSILLAMVMVFSLFSIIPISAEGVDKATAVSNLKNAWRALDYNSYMAKTVFNYCKVGAADATWDAAALTPALDAPDDAACTDNYVYNLAGSSSSNPVKIAALPSTASTLPIMPYDINEVDDMYFYYKTDDATEITTQLDFRKTDSAGSAWTNSGFSGTKNIPGTSGEWVKFSFNDYLALFGVTFSSRIINYGNLAHNLISGFGFALYTTSDTTISISNLFIDGDPNVAEARNFTDDEWIVKVVDTDLTELKAQYNDAEDSEEWLAFVAAVEAVEPYYVDAALKTAWIDMIAETPVAANYNLRFWNNGSEDTTNQESATGNLQSESLTYAVPYNCDGVSDSINTIGKYMMLYDDSTTSTADVTDYGFWYKSDRDINASIRLMMNSSNINGAIGSEDYYDFVMSGDNEWHFVSVKSFLGETLMDKFLSTYAASKIHRVYVYLATAVDQSNTDDINVTFGSFAYIAKTVDTSAFSDLEAEELVVAANAVDTDNYYGEENIAEFNAALQAANLAYPDVASAEAIANLGNAYGDIYQPVTIAMSASVNSDQLYPNRYNKGSTANNSMVTVTDTDTAAGLKFATRYSIFSLSAAASSWWTIFETGNISTVASGYGQFSNFDDIYFYYKAENVTVDGTLTVKLDLNGNTTTALTGTIPVDTSVTKWTLVKLSDLAGDSWSTWKNTSDQRITRAFVYPSANLTGDVYLSSMVFVKSLSTPDGWSSMSNEEKITAAYNFNKAMTDAPESYVDTADFSATLEAAFDFYPELEEELKASEVVDNAVKQLKNTWNAMTYTKNFNLGIGYHGGYKPAGTLSAYAVDDAPAGFAPVPSYKFNYAASAMQTGYSLGIDGKTSMVPFKMDQISDIKVWYKSTGDVTTTALVSSTDLTNGYSIGTSGAKTLPSTNGEWKQISYIEWFESAFATTWNSRIINYNSSDTHFAIIGFGVAQADVDITFGAMTIVPTINVDLQDSASWSNAQWVVNSFDIDLADYADGDAKEAFKSAREAAKGYYTENFAAQDVIDAANKLSGLGLKPSTLIERAQFDENGEWAGDGASYSANTNYLSNNGDQYVTINTEDFGNTSCSPDSGAVQYEAVADGGFKLADIDDISFSYKIENKVGPDVVARIWFYNENYSRYLRTENEEGDEEFVLDDEGNEIIDRNNWQTGMEAYGTTRYFVVDADTDGWVTTSIATIFGSDWKTHYLGYLNGSDIKTEDFTADNTYITKLALGFNGYNIEGDYADVTLGSMYVDYADDRFAIDANCADPAAVLAEALTIDASGCKKADADAFKKAVKALADALEENISAANCVAGNNAVTLVDLSLLARYVDAADKDAFVANNYIDLTAADINGDDVINEADVTALRLAMLTPAES